MIRKLLIPAALVAAVAAPAALQAHRMWLMPSITVVSGEDDWVTFDAAASTNVFESDHQPLRVQPEVAQPDGSAGKAENFATGRYRSTFDVHLTQKGTWKVYLANGGVMGSYTLNGKEERLPRGTTADKLATAIPAGATDVKLTESDNRYVVYVTSGAPTDTVLKPTGKGLEASFATHPNDLVAGEPLAVTFLLDGKPATGLKVTLAKAGMRYRDATQEQELTTDAQGRVTLKWTGPGMYWLNTSATGVSTAIPNAQKRMAYTTTLEVLNS
ncbi:DUF4198 domain-containing protein [Sphingomonas sp.]|uniref:DUF4198 domain-containing protein n=1 Tax=Sphingomonas sp. TaxID=28214 RepID=UPI002DD67EE7|nr:DUF4198 domain-containing protein [Sphingomonas sp.]